MSITWQEQVDDAGCGIACLAMLLDVPYARVVAQAPMLCGKTCGVDVDVMDEVLAENGYAVQRVYRHKLFDRSRRPKWPVKPWAEKHLCMVYVTRADGEARKEEEGHYICLDRNGVVYDPVDPEFVPSRLSRYFRVVWIAAIHKVPSLDAERQ